MRSLQTKMMLMFSVLIVAAVVSIGATMYRSSVQLVTSSIGSQAQSVLTQVMKRIDPAVFEAIASEQSGEYKQLRQKLNEIRETNGLKYLYTMRKVETGGKTEYRYAVDGMPEGSPDASPFGKVEEEGTERIAEVFRSGQPSVGELDVTDAYGATLSAYVPIRNAAGQTIGVIGADFDATAVYELLAKNKRDSLIAGVSVTLIALLLVFLLAQFLVGPIRKLTLLINQVGRGDLTVEIAAGAKDEIGILTNAFRQTVGELRRIIQAIQQQADVLKQSSEQLAASSAVTEQRSSMISRTMQEAAGGADVQLQRSLDTAQAMDQVAQGISRIAASAAHVAESSQQTNRIAAVGNETVLQVVEQMSLIRSASETMQGVVRSLTDRSEKIGEIVGTIGSIAAQTNILALNAGIEAARAGELGRGFAVVATEIRKLAEQASLSSGQIAELIETVQDEIRDTASALDTSVSEVRSGQTVAVKSGETFELIRSEIGEVAVRFEDVSDSSRSIADNVARVSESVFEVTEITKTAARHFTDVSEATEDQLRTLKEMADSVVSLNRIAEQLYELVNKFKV